jgi:hypothetical protein
LNHLLGGGGGEGAAEGFISLQPLIFNCF